MQKVESTLVGVGDSGDIFAISKEDKTHSQTVIVTQVHDVNKIGHKWERRQRMFAVFLCAMSTLFEGINSSLSAPFFPDKANEKGLSQSQVGWVTAAIEITGLAASLLIGTIISPRFLRLFFQLGLLWSSTSVACFGWSSNSKNGTTFFVLCLLTRCCNGVGSALLHNATLPLAAGFFPQKVALVTAIVHSCNGLGVLMGPLFGSVVFSIGGYQWPFIVTGIFGAIILITSMCLMPNATSASRKPTKLKSGEFLRFLIKPRVFLFLLSSVVLISTTGFKNAAFSRYYSTNLNVSDELSGYMFLPFALGFFIAAPICGILVEKGFGARIDITAQIIACSMMFCFFVPSFVPKLENVYYILGILFPFH